MGVDHWKLPDGTFIALDNAEVQGLAAAVLQHVQGAFEVEKLTADAIGAGTVTTLAEVDAAFDAAGA